MKPKRIRILFLVFFLGLLFPTFILRAEESRPSVWQQDLAKLKLQKVKAPRNTPKYVEACIALANQYNLNRKPEARDRAKEAIDVSQKINFRRGLIEAYAVLGQAEYLATNFESSFSAYKKVAELVQDTTKEYVFLAQAYTGMASARFGLASFATATSLINTALEYALLSKDVHQIGLTYRNYAFIIGMNASREEVIAANDSALKYLKLAGDAYTIATVHDNIAIVCTHIPDRQDVEAIKFGLENSKKAIAYFEAKGLLANLGMAYATLGQLYCQLENYPEGFSYLDKGIEQMKLDKNYRNLAAAFVGYAKINLRLKDFEKVIKYASSASLLAEEHKINDLAAFSYNLQSIAYENLGDLEKAYVFSKKSKSLGQRVFADSLRNSLIRSELKYEQLLKTARESVKEEEIATQRKNILMLSIGVVALLVILTTLTTLYLKLRNQGKTLLLQKKEIEKKNEMLNESNKTKDKLFSIISHDLRGPLGTYKIATDYLMNLVEEGDMEGILAISQAMKRSSASIADMVDNLLVWSQAQADGFKISIEKIKVVDVFEQLKSFHQKTAEGKNINIHIEVEPNLSINTDRNCLEVIFRNVLVNAIKFTPPNGDIWLFAKRKDVQFVEIGVKDSGLGMDEEQKALLFSLDKRKNRLGTNGESSHGLGMLLVKEMADLIGAQIELQSEVGKGTTISLHIKEKQVVNSLSNKTSSLLPNT